VRAPFSREEQSRAMGRPLQTRGYRRTGQGSVPSDVFSAQGAPCEQQVFAVIAVAHLSAASILAGCTKVNVAPLGSTSDGRRQYELSCNERATTNGACHAKATKVCGGDYETQHLTSTGPDVASNEGRVYGTQGNPADRLQEQLSTVPRG